MGRTNVLGQLQLEIMRILWYRGESTVAQVHATLHRKRGLATTTIATILSRLEEQGFVQRRTLGRLYLYRAQVSEQDIRRSMVADLIDNLFAGDTAALVSHLVREAEIGPDDLAQIQTLFAAGARERG